MGNWVIWWRSVLPTSHLVLMLGGSAQLLGLKPLDTFITGELKRKTMGSHDHRSHVDKNIAVDCLAGKIVIFVGLDVESRHEVIFIKLKIFYQTL